MSIEKGIQKSRYLTEEKLSPLEDGKLFLLAPDLLDKIAKEFIQGNADNLGLPTVRNGKVIPEYPLLKKLLTYDPAGFPQDYDGGNYTTLIEKLFTSRSFDRGLNPYQTIAKAYDVLLHLKVTDQLMTFVSDKEKILGALVLTPPRMGYSWSIFLIHGQGLVEFDYTPAQERSIEEGHFWNRRQYVVTDEEKVETYPFDNAGTATYRSFDPFHRPFDHFTQTFYHAVVGAFNPVNCNTIHRANFGRVIALKRMTRSYSDTKSTI